MGSGFDDFLTRRPTRFLTTGPYNPYTADQTTPYVKLDEADWFDTYEQGQARKKCQIREIIWCEESGRFQQPGARREYRGYGVFYLKDGRTFAKRGRAEFIWCRPALVPTHIKERLESEWQRLRGE